MVKSLCGIVTLVTVLSPRPVAAQQSPELVQAVIRRGVEVVTTPAPSVLCVTVAPAGATGSRDIVGDEIPDLQADSIRVIGGSECREYRTGARHQASGAEAVTFRIELSGSPISGRAWVLLTWFRDARRAGWSRCEATRQEDRWSLAGCTEGSGVRRSMRLSVNVPEPLAGGGDEWRVSEVSS